MKKTHLFPAFLSGMLLMVFLTTLMGTALAASGQISFNQAGVSLFSMEKITKGTPYVVSNGQIVPSVITYSDESGGKTNYLSLRQLSELLDMEIVWNKDKENVELAPRPAGIVTVGNETAPAKAPKYGETVGPFTEIDPSTVDTTKSPGLSLGKIHTISNSGFDRSSFFPPESGQNIVYTVTNNGNTHQLITVMRDVAIGTDEPFTSVLLAPGKTPTRALVLLQTSAWKPM